MQPGPQTREELLLRAGARDGRERAGHVGEGVGVAAADRRHARLAAHDPGPLVVALGHRPVQGLDEGKPAEGQAQVGELPRAGERGEEVVDRGRQALLGQEREERLEVAPPGLEGLVLPLVEAEDVDVELPPAVEEDRHLLAHEGVGQVGEREGPLDRVVVGERHEVHPPPPRPVVDLERVGIALPPDVLQHRDLRAARVPGVDVQVAAHQLRTLAFMATSRSGSAIPRHAHWSVRGWRRSDGKGNTRVTGR